MCYPQRVIDLDAVVRKVRDLDPLPASAARLASIVANTDVNISEVLDVIAYDPALTGRLLRVANSGASASARQVVTAKDAVLRLGLGRVLALAVGGFVSQKMFSAIPEFGLDRGALWKHSVAAALAAELMQPHTKVEIPRESFTGALLHDIGKLVLARFLSGDILRIMDNARQAGVADPIALELEVLEVHHGEVGAAIAEAWKLPAPIVRAIQYHHDPDTGGDAVCHVIALSNEIAHDIEAEEFDPATLRESSRTLLAISEASCVDLRKQVQARVTEVMARFA